MSISGRGKRAAGAGGKLPGKRRCCGAHRGNPPTSRVHCFGKRNRARRRHFSPGVPGDRVAGHFQSTAAWATRLPWRGKLLSSPTSRIPVDPENDMSRVSGGAAASRPTILLAVAAYARLRRGIAATSNGPGIHLGAAPMKA